MFGFLLVHFTPEILHLSKEQISNLEVDSAAAKSSWFYFWLHIPILLNSLGAFWAHTLQPGGAFPIESHRTSYKHKPSGSLTSMVRVLEPSGIVHLHLSAHQGATYPASFAPSYRHDIPMLNQWQGYSKCDMGTRAWISVHSCGYQAFCFVWQTQPQNEQELQPCILVLCRLLAIGMVGKNRKW